MKLFFLRVNATKNAKKNRVCNNGILNNIKFVWLIKLNRDMDDRECTHNNGRDRVGSVVVGMGNRTTWMGGRTRRTNGFFVHNIFYINHACRLLPFPGPCYRQTKLYLHGSSQILFRSVYLYIFLFVCCWSIILKIKFYDN